jgi:hypothetical protein
MGTMMRGKFWIITVVLTISISAHATDCPPEGKPGIWSANATYLCSHTTEKAPPQGLARDMRVYSPDHRKVIHVVNDRWFVEIGGSTLALGSGKDHVSYYPAELSWTTDSTAFCITQSDATSEIDGFHTEAYRLSEGNIEPLPNIDETVHEQFDRRDDCIRYFQGKKYNENHPNVAGLAWVDGSAGILLVAEIVPDSDCSPRGYFGGYLLSTADGRILHEYSPQELVEHWSTVLGARLKDDYKDLSTEEKTARP